MIVRDTSSKINHKVVHTLKHNTKYVEIPMGKLP